MDTALLPLLGYASGWALLGLFLLTFFRLVARGRLVTEREAAGMQKQIDHLTETLEVKDQTIGEFRDNIATSNELIRAVLNVAQEKRSS